MQFSENDHRKSLRKHAEFQVNIFSSFSDRCWDAILCIFLHTCDSSVIFDDRIYSRLKSLRIIIRSVPLKIEIPDFQEMLNYTVYIEKNTWLCVMVAVGMPWKCQKFIRFFATASFWHSVLPFGFPLGLRLWWIDMEWPKIHKQESIYATVRSAQPLCAGPVYWCIAPGL